MMHPSRPVRARLSRRHFLAASGASIAAPLIVGPAFGSSVPSLRVGLIGGDSDGISLMSRALRAYRGFQLVAVADETETRAHRALDIFTHPMRRSGPHPQVQVGIETLFVGADAADLLCARHDVDLVFVAGIPAFRPAHVASGIAQGKHVFMLGPGATDVAGCLLLEAAADQAETMGLSIGVDLADGNSPLAAPGAIDVRWQRSPWRRAVEGGDTIANWYFEPHLSGSVLLSEGFHTVDGLNQLKGSLPLLAEGSSAPGVEDYAVRYVYPDGGRAAVHFTLGRNLPTIVSTKIGDATPSAQLPVAGSSEMSPFLEDLRRGRTTKWRPRFDRLVSSTRTAILGREAARAQTSLAWSDIA